MFPPVARAPRPVTVPVTLKLPVTLTKVGGAGTSPGRAKDDIRVDRGHPGAGRRSLVTSRKVAIHLELLVPIEVELLDPKIVGEASQVDGSAYSGTIQGWVHTRRPLNPG